MALLHAHSLIHTRCVVSKLAVVRIPFFLIMSQTCAAKITRNLSAGGEQADISVCFDCFIGGKSSMTHWVWTEPRTGWTNYSGLDNVSNTNSHAKNSSRRGKTRLSIGCDNYNFPTATLSKAREMQFFSDSLGLISVFVQYCCNCVQKAKRYSKVTGSADLRKRLLNVTWASN